MFLVNIRVTHTHTGERYNHNISVRLNVCVLCLYSREKGILKCYIINEFRA